MPLDKCPGRYRARYAQPDNGKVGNATTRPQVRFKRIRFTWCCLRGCACNGSGGRGHLQRFLRGFWSCRGTCRGSSRCRPSCLPVRY